MPGTIHTRSEGGVGTLVFDHPERRNAVSVNMWAALPDALAGFAQDPDVRVVVMRGAGDKAFVSGADISQFDEQRSGDNHAGYDDAAALAFLALASFDKPLIAMIHGYCIGGGLAIALTADLRYADEHSRFAIPAARLGVGYHMGGVGDLAALVGMSTALEIFYTARKFDADEALRTGLVNAIVPATELEAHVQGVAAQISENAPLTIRAVKLAAQELSRPDGKRDYARVNAAVAACYASEDYKEGIAAFLGKRRPAFRGR